MAHQLLLSNLETVLYPDWSNENIGRDVIRLCIVTCGYETRCTYWTEQTLNLLRNNRGTKLLVAGFEDFADHANRKISEEFYLKNDFHIDKYSSRDKNNFLDAVRSATDKCIQLADGKKQVEVHVDYSAMPRLWYCNIVSTLESMLSQRDKLYFWYTRGDYSTVEDYPTAGTSDFRVFAGRPTLSSRFRTHIFGLGFDKIRTRSIWSVIDPQRLFCFLGRAESGPNYVQRVLDEHRDLLSCASFVCQLPIDDFKYSFSKLCSILKEFRTFGDVIVVPDGPKSLTMASSLAVLYLNLPGVVCFHVGRRRTEEFIPVNVPSSGQIYGFSFHGSRSS